MVKRNLLSQGLIIYSLSLLITGLFFQSASAQNSVKTFILKASTILPKDVPVIYGYRDWGKEIEKRTNGDVKFDFYGSESLLKGADALEGTGKGLTDVYMGVPNYHPNKTPFATIGELGFITGKVDATARAMTDIFREYPSFRKEIVRHNIKLMFFFPFPPVVMVSARPIKTLEDLKGKKISAIGSLNKAIARLGGTPVSIDITEVHNAISRLFSGIDKNFLVSDA